MKMDRPDGKNAIQTMWRFDSIQGRECLRECMKLSDGSLTSGRHGSFELGQAPARPNL